MRVVVGVIFRVCLAKKLTSWNMLMMMRKYVFFAVCCFSCVYLGFLLLSSLLLEYSIEYLIRYSMSTRSSGMPEVLNSDLAVSI